jgi:hypothetical protein
METGQQKELEKTEMKRTDSFEVRGEIRRG